MTSEAATTWGAGDYALIADRFEPAARAVVDLARVSGRDRVLDLACGTGNAALIAARRAAAVVGVDFEPVLLEIASTRARAADLDVEWVCADLESSAGGVGDAKFSVVL